MGKKPSPLDIMNTMAGAAHSKAQPKAEMEPDADDMAPKKQPPMKDKKKSSEKAPKLPKLA